MDKDFLIQQGWDVKPAVVFQDNKSGILLESNGTASSSRRTRHIDISYFFVKDRIGNGDVQVDFCPTDDMWGDYFTKPLQGAKFLKIRQVIMNEPGGRSVLESDDLGEESEHPREADDMGAGDCENGESN